MYQPKLAELTPENIRRWRDGDWNDFSFLDDTGDLQMVTNFHDEEEWYVVDTGIDGYYVGLLDEDELNIALTNRIANENLVRQESEIEQAWRLFCEWVQASENIRDTFELNLYTDGSGYITDDFGSQVAHFRSLAGLIVWLKHELANA